MTSAAPCGSYGLTDEAYVMDSIVQSAPVECIFSQSDIIIWMHKARMSDELLEMLTS